VNIADDIAITRRHLPLFYYVKEQCNFLSQIQKFILKKEKRKIRDHSNSLAI